jgi:protein-disulfide isomerase
VEYGDFQCPHCGRAAPVIRELLQRFDGQLRFVFRHLPLVDIHPYAAIAAEASEAAGAQARFWEMHDALYAHQDDLDVHDLVRYAGELGLDVDRFSAALRDGQFSGRVAQDVHSAETAGVAGTPGFFINGLRYRGAHDFATFEVRLEQALEMAELRARASAGASEGVEASGRAEAPEASEGVKAGPASG